MITKEIALTQPRELWHVSLRNAEGTPLRCRSNGQCKTWKLGPKTSASPSSTDCATASTSPSRTRQTGNYRSPTMHFNAPNSNWPETVETAAARLYPGQTFDIALPQQWVDKLLDRLSLVPNATTEELLRTLTRPQRERLLRR